MGSEAVGFSSSCLFHISVYTLPLPAPIHAENGLHSLMLLLRLGLLPRLAE